ncbi:hypothetical protein [Romboutsia sp. 1001713B170207_170306_H8]|uniref:hypothetical protein n=2 Tax=unclassified Romboutsia TaxID=2626894 RepID=UPI000822D3E9|nr:hypothetical protein [Romboutsia sp. 1001713B170207_170306_H8]SCH20791.1 Uncharacterised protein [uncultured Clostridium sp.]
MNFSVSLNPYYLYSISLSLILVLYNLGWSNLYPKLSTVSMIFFISTIIISIVLGYFYDKKFVQKKVDKRNPLNIGILSILILLGNVLEFIYEGAIPFVEIAILKNDYVYIHYAGIPTFHVILFTFNAFLAVYTFHRLLVEKKKIYIVYFLINLLPSLLTYNRGMLMMIVISCVSVFVLEMWKGLLSLKNIAFLSIFAIVFLYIFGIMGNVRSNYNHDTKGNVNDSTYIMAVGEASDSFRNSIVPKPMFWGYIYMTSPLANFEENVRYYNNVPLNLENTSKFLKTSILPDFIGKRIESISPQEYDEVKQVSPHLTVSSMFSSAFVNSGWGGVILIYVYFALLVLVYRYLLGNDSQFLITGMAIMNTITMLNFFSNMFTFSGLSFQLVYPLLFSLLFSKRCFDKVVVLLRKIKIVN